MTKTCRLGSRLLKVFLLLIFVFSQSVLAIKIKPVKYSSDTKRFFITSKSQCCLMTPNFGTSELGNQSGVMRIKYTLDGDDVRVYCHCASMPNGVNWCGFCCATCPNPYYMTGSFTCIR